MDPQTPPSKSVFQNPYLYSGVIVLAVLVYISFLMLSRYESNRAYERHNAEKAAEQQRENDLAAVEQLGGSELAVRALYVSPESIRRGQTAQLCYDVANAKTVTLAPPASDEVLALAQPLRERFPPKNHYLHSHHLRRFRQNRLPNRRAPSPLVPAHL